MIRIDRRITDELTDADTFDDHIVVALDQIRLLDEVTGFGVVPAWFGIVLPLDQTGRPGELEHTGCRQFVVDLHLEAGPRRSVRAEFGAADDDHQIGGVDIEVGPLRRRRRNGGPRRRGQCRDQMIRGLLLGIGVDRACHRLLTRLGGQGGQIQIDLGQSAGQVGLHRFPRSRDLRLDVAQGQQHARHLLGGVGGHAGFLDPVDDDVVVAHQAGAAGPADQRVRQADSLRPRGLGLPPGHDGVECGLRLAVGAVTAEHAAVRGARKHHVQACRDVAVGADVGQAGDEPLHGPQQHLHLHLGARPGVGQISAHSRRREREQQCRREGVLEVDRFRPEALGLLGPDPLGQRVDVVVGGHVRRQHPQLRAEAGVVAVEAAVEPEPAVVQLGRRRDDSRTTVEQLCHHRRRDRSLRGARHDGDLFGVATLARVLRTGSGAGVERGVDVQSRSQRLALPVGRLGADDVSGPFEALRQVSPIGLDVVFGHQPDLGQILTRTGPPVVEQHRLAAVERRGDQAGPVRTEFGGDQVDELRVRGRLRGDDGGTVSQLIEDRPRRRGEHTVGSGDLLGELAQSSGVHDSTSGTAGGRQRHRHTATRTHCGHRGVDHLVDTGGVPQRAVVQTAECTTAHAGSLTGAQRDLDGHMLGPAVAEFPGLLDPLGDVGGTLAGRPEDGAQLIVDRIGKHRAEGLVRPGQLGHLGLQTGQVCFRGTVDGAEVELRAEVDQHLVAP